MTSKDEKLHRLREKKFFEAGGGMWFRNSDNRQIVVQVQFYPKLRLWFVEAGTEHAIAKEELDRDYHRLRV